MRAWMTAGLAALLVATQAGAKHAQPARAAGRFVQAPRDGHVPASTAGDHGRVWQPVKKSRPAAEPPARGVTMGAWGPGSFENDDALDWLGELARGHGPTPIRDALSAVAESDGSVEVPEASAALAAAEVVAALLGRPSPTLPEEAAGWARAHRSAARPWMHDLARRAVERVERDSELRDAWLESGDAGAWEAAVRDLRSRLR